MISQHAQARMQQRAIPLRAVDVLMDYGEHHRHHGAEVYYLTRRSRTAIIKELGKRAFLKLEKALDAYLVVSDDGCLITAGHRRQRLKF